MLNKTKANLLKVEKLMKFIFKEYILTKDKRKLLISFLGLILIFCCFYKFFFYQKKSFQNLSILTISVVSPIYGTINKEILVTGTIVPKEEILISTDLTSSKIKSIFVKQGDYVTKGQKLLELDNEILKNNLKELESEYEFANENYQKSLKLVKHQAVSKDTLAKHYKDMEITKAKLENAKLKFTNSEIYSSASGTIFEKNATIGSFVSFDKPLFRIILDNKIEIAAEVSENSLHALKIEQEAIIHIPQNNEPIIGKICLINFKIDQQTRCGKIHLCFEHDNPYPIGLFVSTNIIESTASGMMLPISALHEDKNNSYIWKIEEGNIAKILPVKVKIKDHNKN